jgi:hypothetical protein
VIGPHVLPKHEITDKERATAQMIAASHQMYSALKALVDLKEWKMCMKRQHIHLIETLYGQICARAGFKFQKSNGSRRICAIF